MKSKLFGILYSLALVAFTVFILLDFFVIERVYEVVDDTSFDVVLDSSAHDKSNAPSAEDSSLPSGGEQSDEAESEDKVSNDTQISTPSAEDESSTVVTENRYEDENICIVLTEHRVEDTTVYVADVNIKSPAFLKTAFAKNAYGKNVLQKTSAISESKNAILAINGDYYSKRDGCVLRNGKLYRDFSGDSEQEALIIHADGAFEIVTEDEASGSELVAQNVLQVLSFGPALVNDGEVSVGVNDEVDKAMRNNPRTAIGWYGGTHYAFVVGDGRTDESKGLSLYELGCFMQELGVKIAYNLDGGGSSTMYFNGEVVNNPTTNGKKISEREVSDIVYIGY